MSIEETLQRVQDKAPRRRVPMPTCVRCGRVRVLSPCRDCATVQESKDYPELPPKE